MGAIAGIGSLAVRIALLGEIPGTTRYADLNQMWFAALVLVPIAILFLYLGLRREANAGGHGGAIAAIIGSALAAGGNAVEFQYGNEQGFMVFALGSVIFALGMLGFGVSLWRRLPANVASAVVAVGPLGFLTTIAGPIGVAAAVLFSAAWIVVAIGRGRR